MPPAEEMRRCPVHGLHYDPSQASGCALCRCAPSSERSDEGRPWFLYLTVGIVIAGIGSTALTGWHPVDDLVRAVRRFTQRGDPSTQQPELARAPPATVDAGARAPACGALREPETYQDGGTTYVLPGGRPKERTAVMVLLAGAPDAAILATRFRALALDRGFALLVVDATAEIPSTEASKDTAIPALAALETLTHDPCLVPDRARTLLVGYADRARVAAELATKHPEFTSFALIHGPPDLGTLGPRHVRGWLSAPHGRSSYSRADAERDASQLRQLGFDIDLDLGTAEPPQPEAQALVDWWLALE